MSHPSGTIDGDEEVTVPCYLIHFEQPFGHAEHYLGYAKNMYNLALRIKHHRDGNGANLMRHVGKAGIDWHVVRIWPNGDQTFERSLKVTNVKRNCPECYPQNRRAHRYYSTVDPAEIEEILR